MTIWLCIGYLLTHSLMVLFGRNRPRHFLRVVLLNTGLTAGFVGILFGGSLFLRLWLPVVFFWWAYRWSSRTLGTFHPLEFSLDPKILNLEGRFLGQPSLWWARRGNPWLIEVLHFFYFSYYLYTPVIGIVLYVDGRFREFEAMTFAVLLGYAVSYIFFAVTPVWGPRWALVKSGLLDPSEQQLQGYWFTRIINFIMYGGIALKGGAMPSAHSSTAIVFLVWSWVLWGGWGGIPATVIVTGMGVGSVYGRYHYVFDVLCGALLGAVCLWVAYGLLLA